MTDLEQLIILKCLYRLMQDLSSRTDDEEWFDVEESTLRDALGDWIDRLEGKND